MIIEDNSDNKRNLVKSINNLDSYFPELENILGYFFSNNNRFIFAYSSEKVFIIDMICKSIFKTFIHNYNDSILKIENNINDLVIFAIVNNQLIIEIHSKILNSLFLEIEDLSQIKLIKSNIDLKKFVNIFFISNELCILLLNDSLNFINPSNLNNINIFENFENKIPINFFYKKIILYIFFFNSEKTKIILNIYNLESKIKIDTISFMSNNLNNVKIKFIKYPNIFLIQIDNNKIKILDTEKNKKFENILIFKENIDIDNYFIIFYKMKNCFITFNKLNDQIEYKKYKNLLDIFKDKKSKLINFKVENINNLKFDEVYNTVFTVKEKKLFILEFFGYIYYEKYWMKFVCINNYKEYVEKEDEYDSFKFKKSFEEFHKDIKNIK